VSAVTTSRVVTGGDMRAGVVKRRRGVCGVTCGDWAGALAGVR